MTPRPGVVKAVLFALAMVAILVGGLAVFAWTIAGALDPRAGNWWVLGVFAIVVFASLLSAALHALGATCSGRRP